MSQTKTQLLDGRTSPLVFPSGNGTSGQVLSTDGSGALSWVDRFSAAGPAFRGYANTSTTLNNTVATKVTIDQETFDTTGNFSSSRFTPSVAGYYYVSAGANISAVATNYTPGIFKNGSAYNWGVELSNQYRSTVSAFVYLNGSTDYVEFYIYQASGTTRATQTGSPETYFSGFLARPA